MKLLLAEPQASPRRAVRHIFEGVELTLMYFFFLYFYTFSLLLEKMVASGTLEERVGQYPQW